MSVQIIKGDLLESNVDYICHQVNCKGKMNSGIAKSIREKWPKVYEEYFSKWTKYSYEDGVLTEQDLLGEIQICETSQKVINMFAQFNYGYNEIRYTSYDAF